MFNDIRDINELKRFFREINENEIKFSPYFYSKLKDRPYLNEGSVINSVKNIDNLQGFQKQIIKGEIRYRIGIKLSNNYNLVLVIKINKSLNIITAWKTSRKWQKSIQK